jgi:hypothetical protein
MKTKSNNLIFVNEMVWSINGKSVSAAVQLGNSEPVYEQKTSSTEKTNPKLGPCQRDNEREIP